MSVKQGILLISSAVCCFYRMSFISKCHIQLLFVNTDLCLRGAVQKAERRTVIDARFYSYNRDHRVCFDVCCIFYSLPLPHPLAQVDKKKMDWIDIHPVWGGISSLPLNFDTCLKQSAHEKQPVIALMHKLQRKHLTRRENTLKVSQLLEESIAPSLSVCCCHWRSSLCFTFNDCFIRKIILFLYDCPALYLTAVPGASLQVWCSRTTGFLSERFGPCRKSWVSLHALGSVCINKWGGIKGAEYETPRCWCWGHNADLSLLFGEFYFLLVHVCSFGQSARE